MAALFYRGAEDDCDGCVWQLYVPEEESLVCLSKEGCMKISDAYLPPIIES